LLAFNLSPQPVAWNAPESATTALPVPGLETPARIGAQWRLPAHGVLVAAAG
jgi:hypothetical protein